jgi:hypothetical protein
MVSTLSWPAHIEHSPAAPDDVIELPILLPEWQVIALEEAARVRGMTVGQLLRKLFADLFPREAVTD